MTAPEFLDSNILIYAYDPDDERKQKIARDLLKRAVKGECGISIQVLTDVAATLLHKVRPKTTPQAVAEILDLLAPIPTFSPDAETVRRAVEAHAEYGVHFYDGMILAAAERAGRTKVWSEDLNAGQEYFGVRVENPFA
ncbi:MAG: PIN domain-containing protein [Candidatus Acidiferrum sp.]